MSRWRGHGLRMGWAGMTVLLPTMGLDRQNITTRRNPATGHRQLLTTHVLAALKNRIAHDAFCLLGITMEDPQP